MMSPQQFCFWHLTAYIPLLPSPSSLGDMLSVFAHIYIFFLKLSNNIFLDETTFQTCAAILECPLSDISLSSMYFYLPTNSSNVNALTGFTVLAIRCFRIEKAFWFFYIYFKLQCHLFGDVRSELFSLSQCVCVRLCERELCCDYVWLCMFVCVLVWGRKGAVGRKVRKKRDREVANKLIFLPCFCLFIFWCS